MTELDKAHLGLIKAQTEAATARANASPWHAISTGQGEIVRVNPATGEAQPITDVRPRQAPLMGENDVLTQGRNLLNIIGDPTKGNARASALENYKKLQEQYPKLLSPYQVPAAAAPAQPVDNSGSLFGSMPDYPWWSLFGAAGAAKHFMGGGEEPATASSTASKYKVETE